VKDVLQGNILLREGKQMPQDDWNTLIELLVAKFKYLNPVERQVVKSAQLSIVDFLRGH